MTLTLSQLHPVEMLPVRVIRITKKQFTIIDPEDWPAVNKNKWHATRLSNSWYAINDTRENGRHSKNTTSGRKAVFLHCIITGFQYTDHINGNGLDNRRCNLRPITRANNAKNCFSRRIGASRFKGVSQKNDGGTPWRARISLGGGVKRSLGCFHTEEDAARAYDEAARILHGEYGRYNFPRPGEQSAIRKDDPRLPPGTSR